MLVLRLRLVPYKKESTLVWGSLRVRRRRLLVSEAEAAGVGTLELYRRGRLLVSALYSSTAGVDRLYSSAALQLCSLSNRIQSASTRMLEFDSMGPSPRCPHQKAETFGRDLNRLRFSIPR